MQADKEDDELKGKHSNPSMTFCVSEVPGVLAPSYSPAFFILQLSVAEGSRVLNYLHFMLEASSSFFGFPSFLPISNPTQLLE